MNNFIDLAKRRHSVRRYENKEVEKEKISLILESGRIAPTAANQQPCKFLVLNKENSLKQLNSSCNYHQAPLVIVICADKNIAWQRPFDAHLMVDIDATIATDHMMLCAKDLGLSSCWITYFKPDVLRKEFNIPDNIVPVNILAIGYSAEPEKSHERYNTDRKGLDTLVHYDSF